MSVREEDTFEVVPKGKDHDAHEQNQADLLRKLTLSLPQRFAQNAFDQEEKQVTAIENGDRQQIQDTQVDAEERDQKNYIGRTLGGGFSGNFRDGQWATDVFARDIANDHLVQTDDREFRPLPCGFEAVVHRHQRIRRSHERSIRPGNADLADLNRLTVDRRAFSERRHRQRYPVAVAQDIHLKRFARAVFDETRHLRPGVDRATINRKHPVSFPESGSGSRFAWYHFIDDRWNLFDSQVIA